MKTFGGVFAVCAPIVVFAYKRPDCLKGALLALSECDLAKQSKLYVFIDGPKSEQDCNAVKETFAVASEAKWLDAFASVEVVSSVRNKGLANSIISGVMYVMNMHNRVIVLEDDLLVSRDFLYFMNMCLDYYEDEERISSIGGFSQIVSKVTCRNGIFKSKMGCSCGWATWKDRWNQIIWDKDYYVQINREAFWRQLEKVQYGLAKIFQNYIAGNTDTWAVRWDASNILANRYTLYPLKSKIQNIGFDANATNSSSRFDKRSKITRTESTFLCLPFDEICDLSKEQRRSCKPSIMERILDYTKEAMKHYLRGKVDI